MGTRVSYRIGESVVLYSNNSHAEEDPEALFRECVERYPDRPQKLVEELLELTYEDSSGLNKAGDPVFRIDFAPGDFEKLIVAKFNRNDVLEVEEYDSTDATSLDLRKKLRHAFSMEFNGGEFISTGDPVMHQEMTSARAWAEWGYDQAILQGLLKR